jgi:hypothetical protein
MEPLLSANLAGNGNKLRSPCVTGFTEFVAMPPKKPRLALENCSDRSEAATGPDLLRLAQVTERWYNYCSCVYMAGSDRGYNYGREIQSYAGRGRVSWNG